jgi:hypothetical protein
LGFGLWALGFGLWALGFGLWALGFGLWALGFGLRALGFGGPEAIELRSMDSRGRLSPHELGVAMRGRKWDDGAVVR